MKSARSTPRQGGDVVLALALQGFGGLGQLMVPAVELRPGVARLEQRIALLQRPGIAPPLTEVVRFHVEQPPVEEASARLTAA